MRPIEKYLNEVKIKAGIVSDRELARKLGIKHPSICHIRSGENTPSEETCRKLAAIAGDPYEKVLLLAQVSKAPEVSRSAWERILKATAKAGIFTLGAALFLALAAPSMLYASETHPYAPRWPQVRLIQLTHYPLCDISRSAFFRHYACRPLIKDS